jgi:hypothetical protein
MIGGAGAPGGGFLISVDTDSRLSGANEPRATIFDHVEIEIGFLCSHTTPTRTGRPVLGYSYAAIAERQTS